MTFNSAVVLTVILFAIAAFLLHRFAPETFWGLVRALRRLTASALRAIASRLDPQS
jgi:hypothetical protein